MPNTIKLIKLTTKTQIWLWERERERERVKNLQSFDEVFAALHGDLVEGHGWIDRPRLLHFHYCFGTNFQPYNQFQIQLHYIYIYICKQE